MIGSRQQLLDATKVYREPVSAAEISARYTTTQTGCANEDCLVVAKQLIDHGLNPAVLNLADAYHACGMYNSGSGAQEESLCRASTLSLTLYQYYNKMWAKKAGVPLRPVSAYPMNIHFGGIYSPGVTVFRDNQDTGFALREEPYQTAIKIQVLRFARNPIRQLSSLWLHLTSRLGTRPTIWSIVLTMVVLLRKENRSCSTRSEPSIALPCSMVITPLSWVHSVVACSNSSP